MIIKNTKSDSTITLKRHKKLPSFAETGIMKKIKLDGKDQNFILHPTKPTSVRVSLIINGERFYRDDQEFKTYVEGLKHPANVFETVQKEVKAKAAPKSTEAKPKATEPKTKAKAAAAGGDSPTEAPAKMSKEQRKKMLAPQQAFNPKLDTCKLCGNKAIYCTVNGQPRCQKCATTVAA